MSCAVWSELVEAGDELLREGSPVRLRAESHFAECPACARRAYLLDPGWAVRGLGPARFSTEETAELERKILDSTRVLGLGKEMRLERSGRRRAGVLAAGVVIALATTAGLSLRRGAGEAPAPPPVSAAVELFGADRSGSTVQSLPRLGGLQPAEARVYELGQKDFALVMVVHETLDL